MRFVLTHRHEETQCAIAYAAWRGFESPLRHERALGTCAGGPGQEGREHLLIWTVDAPSSGEAMAMLPPWLAERAEARRVAEVAIP